jgi:Fe-S cluster assembly iron-binding protein IscA
MAVNVEVSKEAIAEVRQLISGKPAGTEVRLFLAPGEAAGGCGDAGCDCGEGASTATFGLAFDTRKPQDMVIPVDGFSLLVDETAAPEVDGARIEFVRTLDASGFTVTLPGKSTPPPIGSGCGCGGAGCGCG